MQVYETLHGSNFELGELNREQAANTGSLEMETVFYNILKIANDIAQLWYDIHMGKFVSF